MITMVEIRPGQNQIRRERAVLEGRSRYTHRGKGQKVQKNFFDLWVNSIEAYH